jgi:MHS family proline/betaine transporter-like MFS transporter
MIIVFPIAAYVSDKIGRKPVLMTAVIALILMIYPIFLTLQSMNFVLAILSQIVFSAIIGIYMGPIPTLLVELFPTRVRFTGVALSYNLSAAIFGGTAPVVGAALYQFTGDELALSYYLTALAIVGLIVISFYKETYKNNLSADIKHE